ncbi:MAG: branched-chain amino acid ABC transporter permease [Candidatus Heimdallarchaeota archaeon]
MSNIISNIISNITNSISNFINWLREDKRNVIYVFLFLGFLYLMRPYVLCRLCIMELLAFFSVYFIITVSLNLQYGYAGVPNWGMVLPVAAGAYVTGSIAGRIAMWYYGPFKDPDTGQTIVDPISGRPLDFIDNNNLVTSLVNQSLANDPLGGLMIFLITIIIAVLIAAVLGYVASRPAIRLRADYLIIVLITMGEAIRIIGTNYPRLVGGTLWVSVPDIFLWAGDWRSYIYVFLLVGTGILVWVIVQILISSPYGRVLKAVRENELTAETMGKDVVAIKTLILVVGSGIAALAGVLWSFYSKVVVAAAYLRADYTFWPFLMLLIGGLGNNRGAAAGAGGVIVFRRLLYFYKHNISRFFPFSVVYLEQLLLGLALLLFIMFRPQGIIPEESIKMRGIPPEEYEAIHLRARSKAET